MCMCMWAGGLFSLLFSGPPGRRSVLELEHVDSDGSATELLKDVLTIVESKSQMGGVLSLVYAIFITFIITIITILTIIIINYYYY